MRTKKELIKLLKQAAAEDMHRKSAASPWQFADDVFSLGAKAKAVRGAVPPVRPVATARAAAPGRPPVGPRPAAPNSSDHLLNPTSGGSAGPRQAPGPTPGPIPQPQAGPAAGAASAAAAAPSAATAAMTRSRPRGGSGAFLGGMATTAGLGAAGMGAVGAYGALGNEDTYNKTFGYMNQYNPEWDPYKFSLKFQRAGIEQGPLAQMGLMFSQPINTMRQLMGNAPKFDPTKIERYGDFANRSVVQQPDGSYITTGHWQPSEDFRWLQEQSRNNYGYGLPQGSAANPVVQRYLDSLNNDVG